MAHGALRFATLNTWKNEGDYSARTAAMATGLHALEPDVILLQEVFRTTDETSVFRRTADTAQSLGRALNFAAAYAPARRKPRRWGGAEVLSEAGLAILTRGQITWQERLPLPSDERGGERIALLAEVVVRDIRCLVACVHLSHLRDDDARRREQLETVLAHPRWELMSGIVGGDFNCTVSAPAIQAAIAHPRLVVRNVFTTAAPPTHPLPPRPAREGRAIDHLFVVSSNQRKFPAVLAARRALDAPIDGVWPSDHAAVVADVAFADAGKDRP